MDKYAMLSRRLCYKTEIHTWAWLILTLQSLCSMPSASSSVGFFNQLSPRVRSCASSTSSRQQPIHPKHSGWLKEHTLFIKVASSIIIKKHSFSVIHINEIPGHDAVEQLPC